MRFSFFKKYLILKGFMFFLISILIQLLFVLILNMFSNNLLFLKDPLVIITFQYLFSFFFFFIIWKIDKRNISFISNENWFITLGKALLPAILSFGIAFISVMLFISIIEFLPFPEFIKEWIRVPNQGFVEIFDNIEKRQEYKVIIWFFYIIVIAPIVEEFLFRGFLQDTLIKIFKKFNLDIILTSLIFALFHASSLSNALYSLIIGFFLSSQRKYYGSINISIWIHSLINFTGIIYGILLKYYADKLNL